MTERCGRVSLGYRVVSTLLCLRLASVCPSPRLSKARMTAIPILHYNRQQPLDNCGPTWVG